MGRSALELQDAEMVAAFAALDFGFSRFLSTGQDSPDMLWSQDQFWSRGGSAKYAKRVHRPESSGSATATNSSRQRRGSRSQLLEREASGAFASPDGQYDSGAKSGRLSRQAASTHVRPSHGWTRPYGNMQQSSPDEDFHISTEFQRFKSDTDVFCAGMRWPSPIDPSDDSYRLGLSNMGMDTRHDRADMDQGWFLDDQFKPIPDVKKSPEHSCGCAMEPEGSVYSPRETVISKAMSMPDLVSVLVQHGCPDVTHSLDFSTCDEYPIGGGGFGDIYRGKLRDGTSVAIKSMKVAGPDLVEQQRKMKNAAREIHTWSKLNHPYVAKFLGLAQFRGQVAMVSPWAERGSLPTYLRAQHDVDRPQLCVMIAEGLEFLHECGIIHGDLKGANVLVSDDHRPQLCDFGNAVLLESTLQFTYTTAKTNLSARWTAPELFLEGQTYSVEADIYALAMVSVDRKWCRAECLISNSQKTSK
ncbi:Tyrosine-protein kinase [Ceratobasidium sp. AG-Ba]|nr:Tyrosine-protein kinase [Ceratobasidium sp. AG-Ba]